MPKPKPKPKPVVDESPLPRPQRPDYGDNRTPTIHSIMHGAPLGRPMGVPNMDKPPAGPQGPHSDAHAKIEETAREAQHRGMLGDGAVRSAFIPAPGPAMLDAFKSLEAKKPWRFRVYQAHRLAREKSLDLHEEAYRSRLSSHVGEDPMPNTPEHFKSFMAAADLNPYSTTHFLGDKPAAKRFTQGKGEAAKTFDEAFDRTSVAAFTASYGTSFPGLGQEYKDVHDARLAIVNRFQSASELAESVGRPQKRRRIEE